MFILFATSSYRKSTYRSWTFFVLKIVNFHALILDYRRRKDMIAVITVSSKIPKTFVITFKKAIAVGY